MHSEICRWPSHYFYDNRLISRTAINDHFPLKPYTIFSLKYEQTRSNPRDIFNSSEADFIIQMLKVLAISIKPNSYSIGIITPYSNQRDELRAKSKLALI